MIHNYTLVDNQNSTEPSINLAIEEFLARNLNSEVSYLFFYKNKPSVILGKNQNTLEEVDYHFAKAKNIQIVRRISGGGAVYHDLGNLNYSFITPFDPKMVANWQILAKPILDALQQMGIPAQLNYRNDILLYDKKISGTAQYTSKKAIISHGTLLFDSDLDTLYHVLNSPQSKHVHSKSLKSFRSKVINIHDVHKFENIDAFKNTLISHIFNKDKLYKTFSETEWESIRQLASDKYCSWAWNFGRSPAFTIQKTVFSNVEIKIEVARGGKIASFTYDQQEIPEFHQQEYSEENIHKVIQNLDNNTLEKIGFDASNRMKLTDLLY